MIVVLGLGVAHPKAETAKITREENKNQVIEVNNTTNQPLVTEEGYVIEIADAYTETI